MLRAVNMGLMILVAALKYTHIQTIMRLEYDLVLCIIAT